MTRSSRMLLENEMSPGFPGAPVRTPARLRLELIPGRVRARATRRWDACRATASRIGDRWYALGGWLQRSEINLQFKSIGVRARGSSDCRAATAAMISLNLDRFDNGERWDLCEIESRSTAFRSSRRSIREVPDPRALHRRWHPCGRAAPKWEPLDRYRRFD